MNWLNNRRAVPLAGLLVPLSAGCTKSPLWSTTSKRWPTWASSPVPAPLGGAGSAPRRTRARCACTVSGGVDRPGVMEVAQGTALADVLARASARPALGVLVGGYFGTWLSPRRDQRPALGVGPGGTRCGTRVRGGSRHCRRHLPAGRGGRVEPLVGRSTAGQCGPCANGLPTVTAALDELVAGRAGPGAGERIAHWSAMIRGRGACKLPDGAVAFVQSAVTVFADHIEAHRLRGPCPAGEQVLPTPTMVIDR